MEIDVIRPGPISMVSVLVAGLVGSGCTLLAPSDDELTDQRKDSGVSAPFDGGHEPDADGSSDATHADATAGDERADGAPSDGGNTKPPIPLNKLLVWLMADKGVEHNDTAVFAWRDQSGNGLDATQSLKDSYPHLWPTGINGMPALDFDGVADWLALPDGFADFTAGLSMFGVAETGTVVGCTSLVELSNGSERDDIALARNTSIVGYEVVDSDIHEGHGAIPVDIPFLMSATHAPAGTARTFLNGVYSSDSSFPLPQNKRRTANFVGQSLYSECTPWLGRVGEVIIYNRFVTDDERVQIDAYLKAKWKCCGQSG
jgi:hypothetical protein